MEDSEIVMTIIYVIFGAAGLVFGLMLEAWIISIGVTWGMRKARQEQKAEKEAKEVVSVNRGMSRD